MVSVTGDRPDARVLPNLTTPFDPPSVAGPLVVADLQNQSHRINMKQFSGKSRGSCVMLSDNSVWLATGGKVQDPWVPLAGTGYDDTVISQSLASTKEDVGKLLIESILNKPLPFMPLIVPWGDSRSIQNWNSNTTPPAPLARSPAWLIEMLSQRVRLDSDYMQGVSGDDIEQLLTRIQNDTPGTYGTKKPSEVPPSLALLLIGTNGVNKGTNLATLLAQLNAVLDFLVAKGHKVLLLAEWPRGATGNTDNPLTPDNEKLLIAYHNAILKIRRRNVWIVDVWPRVADPASVNAYPRPNMTNPDTLHNSPGISTITAQEAVKVMIDEIGLPRGKITASSNTDQYHATLMPDGCLNKNPMLRKTVTGVAAGTLGSGGAGEVPAGYTLSASAGLTATGSFVTDVLQEDGSLRDVYRVVVTGTPTGPNSYFGLRQTGLAPNTVLNDRLRMNYELTVSGQKNFSAPGMFIDTGVNTTRGHGGLSISGDNIMPAGAIRKYYGVPRSVDVVLNPLPTSLAMEIRPYFTLSGVESAVTCDLMSISVRKVATPQYT
uniref:SGNH hydrolase-type esterase domain-containing protein n=1 Tax=Pseudomonas phage Ulina01 TaxID=3138549 RepID=A0AAU6W017_9CAUD